MAARTRKAHKRPRMRAEQKVAREDHVYVAWLEVVVDGKTRFTPGLAHARAARDAEAEMIDQQRSIHLRKEEVRKLGAKREGIEFVPLALEVRVLWRRRVNGDIAFAKNHFISTVENTGIMNEAMCALLWHAATLGQMHLLRKQRNRRRRLAAK